METFDVSTVSVLLQLSIGAATGAIVTITRPDSSFVTIVASQGFAVFSENNPQAGTWTVSVSTGTIEVSEIARTVVDTTFVYVSEEVTLVPPTIQNCTLHLISIAAGVRPSISNQYDSDNYYRCGISTLYHRHNYHTIMIVSQHSYISVPIHAYIKFSKFSISKVNGIGIHHMLSVHQCRKWV